MYCGDPYSFFFSSLMRIDVQLAWGLTSMFVSNRTLQTFFEGLLPRDNPRNTRFAINFFTSIGLGGLT